MEIVFLPSARRGLLWFRRYYASVFPQGSERAKASYKLMLKTLAAHPEAGREAGTHSRLYPISHTPFAVVYRVREARIEVLAVLDLRGEGREVPSM